MVWQLLSLLHNASPQSHLSSLDPQALLPVVAQLPALALLPAPARLPVAALLLPAAALRLATALLPAALLGGSAPALLPVLPLLPPLPRPPLAVLVPVVAGSCRKQRQRQPRGCRLVRR